jgi:hypothetical protein
MIFKSGRADRIVQMIEYTSAPLLQANTEIRNVEPLGLSFTSARIICSSGRFRKKKVP